MAGARVVGRQPEKQTDNQREAASQSGRSRQAGRHHNRSEQVERQAGAKEAERERSVGEERRGEERRPGRGGHGREGEGSKRAGPHAHRTRRRDDCGDRGAYLQLLARGGGWVWVLGARGGGTEAGRPRHTRCAGVAHIHVGTLLPDTRHGGARERREPGTQEEETDTWRQSPEDRSKQKQDRGGKSLRGDRA